MRNGITNRTDVGPGPTNERTEYLKISDGDPSSAVAEADTIARGIAASPFSVPLMLAAAGCASDSWPQAWGIAAIVGAPVIEASWQD